MNMENLPSKLSAQLPNSQMPRAPPYGLDWQEKLSLQHSWIQVTFSVLPFQKNFTESCQEDTKN